MTKLSIGTKLYFLGPLGPYYGTIEKTTARYVSVRLDNGQAIGIRKDEAGNFLHKATQEELDAYYLWSSDSDRPYWPKEA